MSFPWCFPNNKKISPCMIVGYYFGIKKTKNKTDKIRLKKKKEGYKTIFDMIYKIK